MPAIEKAKMAKNILDKKATIAGIFATNIVASAL